MRGSGRPCDLRKFEARVRGRPGTTTGRLDRQRGIANTHKPCVVVRQTGAAHDEKWAERRAFFVFASSPASLPPLFSQSSLIKDIPLHSRRLP